MKVRLSPSSLLKVLPIAVISVLAAFLRFYRLAEIPPGLHPDEAMNGINALEAWRSGHFQLFYPENNGREGLFINIQALALGLIGQNEPWVLRLVSAIFGTLTVVAFYYFCREFCDELTGRLAALFMATSFWHISVSRIGTRPVSALFFLLWALYLFGRSARKLAAGSRWYWLDVIGAGLLFGMGFHTYSVYRITPLMVLAVLPRMCSQYGWKHVMKLAGIFVATGIVAALPLALYFLQHQVDFVQRVNQVSVFASPHPIRLFFQNIGATAGMYSMAGDQNWRHNLSGSPMLFLPVAILFLFGSWLAALHHRWLLAFWAAGALPSVLSGEGFPHALRSILTIPAVLLAAALGTTWLWRNVASALPRLAIQVMPLVLTGILTSEAYYTYFVTWGSHPVVAGWFYDTAVAHARLLLAVPHDVPKYVVFAPERDTYYVRGLPSSARPIMFLTDSFSLERQQELRIHYLLPDQANQIPHDRVYVDFIPLPPAL